MACNVKYNLLPVVLQLSKHQFVYTNPIPISQSKGFPDGLCHSQDLMKKWNQENNDINEGRSRQLAKHHMQKRASNPR